MNFSVLVLAGLLVIGTISQAEPAATQQSQSLQLSQAQEPPENRTPVAKIDPKQPIQIRVINKSEIDVDIVAELIQPPSDERIAAPGESVTFGRLHTSFLPLPIELAIFHKGQDIVLNNLELKVENNEIIITVAAETGVAGGLREIRVTQSGDIYLF